MGTDLQAPNHVILLAANGEHEDGHRVAVLAKPGSRLEAVDARKVYAEDWASASAVSAGSLRLIVVSDRLLHLIQDPNHAVAGRRPGGRAPYTAVVARRY